MSIARNHEILGNSRVIIGQSPFVIACTCTGVSTRSITRWAFSPDESGEFAGYVKGLSGKFGGLLAETKKTHGKKPEDA